VSARGVHRGVYCVLVDGPDFQALAPVTRHVFLTARLSPQAGPACIFRYYPEVLARQTGWPRAKVDGAIRELVEAGWAQFEDGILWLVNGLRYDPTMRLSNRKHRAAVLRALKGLPRRPIIVRFCQYYNLQRLYDSLSIANPVLAHDGPPKKTEETRSNPNKPEPTRELPPLAPPPRAEEPVEAVVWGKPEDLVALYNAETPDNVPAVEELSAKRREKAVRALRQYASQAWWKEVFAQYRGSRFLRGLVPPPPGRKPFKPDFDWLLSNHKTGVENYVRVHDGIYADG
jgi:hypothetical protein